MPPVPYNDEEEIVYDSGIDIVDTASNEAVTPDEITVVICTVQDDLYSVTTSRNISVAELKDKLSLIVSMGPCYQRLIYKDRMLVDSYRLYDYCPTADEMKIYMTERIYGDMQIFVQHFQGRTLVMKFDKSDTIRSVKCILAAREGIPVEEQRIIFEGRQLVDQRTLSDYNIQRNATMRVSLRMRGGDGQNTKSEL